MTSTSSNILTAFENSQLAQLKQVIGRKDRPDSRRIYKESLTVCYSCHKAADKPYLRPQNSDRACFAHHEFRSPGRRPL